MDGTRFDAWTRILVVRRSRRTTLRTVVAGMLAATLSTAGREAAAKCVNPGKKCKGNDGKKKPCCGGAKCKGGKCKCGGNLLACGGLCADTLSDLQHCGECSNACGGAEICQYGNCCVKTGPPGPHNTCCSGFTCNPPGQNCVCV